MDSNVAAWIESLLKRYKSRTVRCDAGSANLEWWNGAHLKWTGVDLEPTTKNSPDHGGTDQAKWDRTDRLGRSECDGAKQDLGNTMQVGRNPHHVNGKTKGDETHGQQRQLPRPWREHLRLQQHDTTKGDNGKQTGDRRLSSNPEDETRRRRTKFARDGRSSPEMDDS